MLAFKISFILISISFARPSIALFLSPLFAKESWSVNLLLAELKIFDLIENKTGDENEAQTE